MHPVAKILVGVVVAMLVLFVGLGIWGYQKGYYDALRGGFAQDEGRLDEAIGHFRRAYDRNPNAYMVAHDLACCYALKNDRRNCFLWLGKALETDHPDAVRKNARTEIDFTNVREDPEFKSLIDPRPGSP